MSVLKLGATVAFCRETYYERLAQMQELGFVSGDFDIASTWFEPEKEQEYYKHLEEGLDAFKKSGLYLNAVHISFGVNWDISVLDEEVRKTNINKVKEIFDRMNKYEPYCYVFHGSFEPIPQEDRMGQIEQLKKSLNELSSYTDAFLCVEILPRSCLCNTAKETLDIVDAVNKPNLGVCVDVNHFLQEKAEDGLRLLGERVKTLHISDHDYLDEQHWMPGEGKIDWKEVVFALKEIGYTGIFSYEVESYYPVAKIKENFDNFITPLEK